MLVVGLTGGIAAGKSTVSRIFQEIGVPVICTDELARQVVEPGTPALDEIRAVFGAGVFDDHGRLDRVRMADVVFRDPSKRRTLEAIIHPRIAEEKDKRIKELERSGHAVAVVDVPLLYESGWATVFDLVVVVYVPTEIQLERLRERDHLSEEQARARLDAQMPIDDKKRLADFVVDNSGSPEDTREQVQRIAEAFKRLASEREISRCSQERQNCRASTERL